MFNLHRAATTDFACRMVGRRNVVRAVWFVLHCAQLDVPNDLNPNGESPLQQWFLELSAANQQIHVIGVGTNVGRWSGAVLITARQAGRLYDVQPHALEPSSYILALLSEALDRYPARLHRAALCERSGSAAFHVIAPGADTNSLHGPSGSDIGGVTENVVTTTLDSFADGTGLDHVSLVNIDTEGHDPAVLRGARTLFSKCRISIAQFEYKHRWVYACAFLRDAFESLEPLRYHLGKHTPQEVEFHLSWDVALAAFAEGNYIACMPKVTDLLPSLAWWKSASLRGAL
jgi:FkbM family methyltransferase